MIKSASVAAVALFVALATLVSAARPAAAAFECTDQAPASVAGNLVVPAGAFCQLSGGAIGGNVVVEANGLFIGVGGTIGGNVEVKPEGALSLSGVQVNGSVRANGHQSATIDSGTVIAGSVTMTNGVILSTGIDGSWIGGKVVIEGNDQPFINLTNTQIGGSVTDRGNSGPDVLDISGNTIGGSLKCAGNTPAPSVAGNAVTGRVACP
jgi:hypothetical protein